MKRQDDHDALRRIWPHLSPLQRKWLRIQGDAAYAVDRIGRLISRVDLWLFPPAAFVVVFTALSRLKLKHPLALMTILAISLSAATLTLLLAVPQRSRPRR